MQSDKSRLVIHTTIAPQEDEQRQSTGKKKKISWRTLPHPMSRAGKRRRSGRARRPRQPLTAGERLLRNTAVCCALLIGIMAVSRMDAPWSRQVAQTVSGAVTMGMDLDETLGRLNFVRNWIPDTALVFWNMGAEDALAQPVSGALTHAWSQGQPWLEYQVSGEQPVYAAQKGRVAAVSENAQGEWTLLMDHDGGEQTVYAYLGKAIVASGQEVERGAQIGVTGNQEAARLYFELRVNGVSTDPTARLGGR